MNNWAEGMERWRDGRVEGREDSHRIGHYSPDTHRMEPSVSPWLGDWESPCALSGLWVSCVNWLHHQVKALLHLAQGIESLVLAFEAFFNLGKIFEEAIWSPSRIPNPCDEGHHLISPANKECSRNKAERACVHECAPTDTHTSPFILFRD